MKKIVFSTLLASSALVTLVDSAFAKECAFEDSIKEIIVNDPNNSITLRTNYEKEGRDVPEAGNDKPIIGNGETLLIDNDETPKLNKNDELCYYPVKLTKENNSKNTNEEILSFNTYWISEEGIKDYQTIVRKNEVTLAQTEQPNSSLNDNQDNGSSGLSLPEWLPGALAFVLNLLTLVLLVFILKSIKNTTSTLDKKITKASQEQNSKFKKESQDIQQQIGRNKEHVKQLEGLLKAQNEQLYSLADSIKSLSASEPLNQQINRAESTVFGAMYSPQSELYQPGISPVVDQGHVQETQESSGHDPFYSEVISQFNTGSIPWFSYLIQQQSFLKVQITRDSVLGQMDMGGKVTYLKLDEQGTLLIYQAGDKLWVIPDQTQSKWKRAVTDSLFNGGGQTLIRPAEVESVGNSLWRLVEKGEFR